MTLSDLVQPMILVMRSLCHNQLTVANKTVQNHSEFEKNGSVNHRGVVQNSPNQSGLEISMFYLLSISHRHGTWPT